MKKITQNSLILKITCFTFLSIFLLTTILCIGLSTVIYKDDLNAAHMNSRGSFRNQIIEDEVRSTSYRITQKIYSIDSNNINLDKNDYNYVDYSAINDYLENKNVGIIVKDKDGKLIYSYNIKSRNTDTYTVKDIQPSWSNESIEYYSIVEIDKNYTKIDNFYFINILSNLMDEFRNIIYPIILVLIIICTLLSIYLISAVGHKKGHEGIYINWFSKIPFDILCVAYFMLLLVCIDAMRFYAFPVDITESHISIIGNVLIVLIMILLIFVLSFAVRIKSRTLFTNTITYKILKYPARLIKKIFSAVSSILRNMPIMWKAVLAITGIGLINFILILLGTSDAEFLLLFFFLQILISIGILYAVLMFKKINIATKKIADGDMNYRINDKSLIGTFKKHAQDLNTISDGLNIALEERMKSERFKTELITNVSHDIKTPLTSIINYTDLISKEETDNPKIKEHSEVLLRQSSKLKTLIEDLVEASKASTGNLEVNLEKCNIVVLINQATAEYEDVFEELGLNLIMNIPDEAIYIMADGKHLWRIFDNLLCNIKKYSLENTRVYIDISILDKDKTVEISFKNISKYPLDISSDELLERFSRGDTSRNTEGHGLGLSIAYNLSDLQGGHMKISIDGDLFKANLKFKTI